MSGRAQRVVLTGGAGAFHGLCVVAPLSLAEGHACPRERSHDVARFVPRPWSEPSAKANSRESAEKGELSPLPFSQFNFAGK
jgi:hypothetical protein